MPVLICRKVFVMYIAPVLMISACILFISINFVCKVLVLFVDLNHDLYFNRSV